MAACPRSPQSPGSPRTPPRPIPRARPEARPVYPRPVRAQSCSPTRTPPNRMVRPGARTASPAAPVARRVMRSPQTPPQAPPRRCRAIGTSANDSMGLLGNSPLNATFNTSGYYPQDMGNYFSTPIQNVSPPNFGDSLSPGSSYGYNNPNNLLNQSQPTLASISHPSGILDQSAPNMASLLTSQIMDQSPPLMVSTTSETETTPEYSRNTTTSTTFFSNADDDDDEDEFDQDEFDSTYDSFFVDSGLGSPSSAYTSDGGWGATFNRSARPNATYTVAPVGGNATYSVNDGSICRGGCRGLCGTGANVPPCRAGCGGNCSTPGGGTPARNATFNAATPRNATLSFGSPHATYSSATSNATSNAGTPNATFNVSRANATYNAGAAPCPRPRNATFAASPRQLGGTYTADSSFGTDDLANNSDLTPESPSAPFLYSTFNIEPASFQVGPPRPTALGTSPPCAAAGGPGPSGGSGNRTVTKIYKKIIRENPGNDLSMSEFNRGIRGHAQSTPRGRQLNQTHNSSGYQGDESLVDEVSRHLCELENSERDQINNDLASFQRARRRLVEGTTNISSSPQSLNLTR